MKLGKKLSHRNLDGIFRVTLLIYGEKNTKKSMSEFMQDNLRISMVVNLTKNRFLRQVQKI